MIVLHALNLRHPLDMRATEELDRRLPVFHIKTVINATCLHHHHTRILSRAPVQRAAAVGAEMACHFRSAFDDLGERVEGALRCLQAFRRDH